MKPDTIFAVGAFGEIIPSFLGADATVVKKEFEAYVDLRVGIDAIQDLPTERVYDLAAICYHQLRLRYAVAGTVTPSGHSLHEAVMIQRRLLSLRPPMTEDIEISFAPVLQYQGGNRWQVGLTGGRMETYTDPDPAKAVQHAQLLFSSWADEEVR